MSPAPIADRLRFDARLSPKSMPPSGSCTKNWASIWVQMTSLVSSTSFRPDPGSGFHRLWCGPMERCSCVLTLQKLHRSSTCLCANSTALTFPGLRTATTATIRCCLPSSQLWGIKCMRPRLPFSISFGRLLCEARQPASRIMINPPLPGSSHKAAGLLIFD